MESLDYLDNCFNFLSYFAFVNEEGNEENNLSLLKTYLFFFLSFTLRFTCGEFQ